RRHQRPQIACAQAVLDALAALPGERSMVRRDLALAEALTELVSDALRERPCVHEYQCRPMACDVGGDEIEDLAHLVGGNHGLQLAVGQLQRELERAPMAAVDH